MIDLKAARNDPDGYRAALARKGAVEIFDRLLEADEAWRSLQVGSQYNLALRFDNASPRVRSASSTATRPVSTNHRHYHWARADISRCWRGRLMARPSSIRTIT